MVQSIKGGTKILTIVRMVQNFDSGKKSSDVEPMAKEWYNDWVNNSSNLGCDHSLNTCTVNVTQITSLVLTISSFESIFKTMEVLRHGQSRCDDQTIPN